MLILKHTPGTLVCPNASREIKNNQIQLAIFVLLFRFVSHQEQFNRFLGIYLIAWVRASRKKKSSLFLFISSFCGSITIQNRKKNIKSVCLFFLTSE
jgi:hypothetical protein